MLGGLAGLKVDWHLAVSNNTADAIAAIRKNILVVQNEVAVQERIKHV